MKKWTKCALACSLTCATLLGVAGCGTGLTNVENKENGIIYNGGSVVSVGDYLFFANGFASGVDSYKTDSDSEYNNDKQYSYLARLKKSDATLERYESKGNVEKVNSAIAGYSNAYTFVCGDYIYYATPNLHQTGSNLHIWKYISIFRCGLDGNNNKEIYTTVAWDSAKGQMLATEYNGNYYIIIYDGTNLVKISLKDLSVKTLSDKATSVALPSENEEWNGDIYYTKAREKSSLEGNIVCKINVEEEEEKPFSGNNGSTYEFVGRVEDNVYYTISSETYVTNVKNNTSGEFYNTGKRIYSGVLSNILKVGKGNAGEGIIAKTGASGNDVIMYYSETANSWEDNFITDSTSVMFVQGDLVYYSTDKGIFSLNINYEAGQHQKTTIVSDMTIKSGYVGYDFNYANGERASLDNIYFFAQRDYEEEEESETESEEEKDENYYLYTAKADGSGMVKLVGKTI